MSNSVSFHSQLASIMEVLTKTAVAEICELVDDGYAVLHLEISRSRKENEALKRKLQMMELKIARSCSFSRSGIVKFSSESRATASVASSIVPESHFPTADHLFPKRLGSRLWIHGNPAAVNEDPAPVHSEIGHEASYIEEERPKPIIIKEERLEEDGDRCNSQEELKISEERVEWLTTDGVGTSPLVDKQTTPIPGIEELPEQHMTRRTVWEDSDTVLRAESENDSLNAGHQRRGPVQSSGKLDNMDYEYDLYGRPGQTDTFFALGNPETETEGAACSYTTETNSESLLVHSEIQTAAATKGGSDSLTSLRSLEPKSGVGMMDSAPFEMEFEMSPAWNKGSVSGGAYMQHRHYKKDLLSVKPQPENVPNMFPTNSLTTQSRVGMKDKRFICTYCGKSFSSPQNLDTHHRIHTGERPFMCTQCGKRFTQSAHLKSHQSVHTGERPFECTDCGKRFSGKQNLRIHQQKNHSRPPK